MTSIIELETFAPYESTTFKVDVGDNETMDLELIEVKSIKMVDENRDGDMRQEPFRLTFRGGPKDAYIPQQILKLTHDELGDLEIFLVPLGPDSDGMRYEAIFN